MTKWGFFIIGKMSNLALVHVGFDFPACAVQSVLVYSQTLFGRDTLEQRWDRPT